MLLSPPGARRPLREPTRWLWCWGGGNPACLPVTFLTSHPAVHTGQGPGQTRAGSPSSPVTYVSSASTASPRAAPPWMDSMAVE